jgi:hypothetical protein
MSYIGTQPVPQSLQSRQQFTGDGSTTTFATIGGVALYEDVFLNGVRLSRVDNEYSFDGTTLTITPAPANGDTVSIILRNDHSELIALPITDSQGNNVLSESGGVVTLTADAAVLEGSSSGDLVRITQTGSGNALVVEDSTNPDSTPFVVDSSGRLLTGTSSPFNNFRDVQTTTDRTPPIQFSGANAASAGFSQVVWFATATGAFYSPTHWLARSGSSTPGTNALVPSEATLGAITFAGDDGTRFLNAAHITAAVDGTPGTNDMPGRLVFSTTKDGASSPTEAMRIDSNQSVQIKNNSSSDALRITQTGSGNALVVEDSANPDSTPFVIDASGNVGIGTSPSERLDVVVNETANSRIHTDLGGASNKFVYLTIDSGEIYDDSRAVLQFSHDGTASAIIQNNYRSATGISDGLTIRTFEASSIILAPNNTGAMYLDSSGNVNISNLSASSDVQTDASKNLITTSDARLKNDLGVITDSAINVVQQIIPKYFSWKNDESNTQQLGFFAQDIYPVLPEAAPRALKYTEVGRDENDEPILEQVFDEDGNPDYEWGFTDRPIIAMCVKAIQEQQALIESQQSQIDALTARIEALEAN